ncbi:unnamed protein product [Musa hybrid cultivar]
MHSSQISVTGGPIFLLQSAGGCRAIVSCSFSMRKVMAIDGLWVVTTNEVVDTQQRQC